MAWLAVDKDGSECIYDIKPQREKNKWDSATDRSWFIDLPKGTVEKIVGRKITWEDEPIEI